MGAQYVVGDSSPFLKRVLVPFWVVRIGIMCIYIVVNGVALVTLAAYSGDINRELRREGYTINIGAVIAIVAVTLAIVLFCLSLDIACIVKRGRRTLTPRFFLIVNVIQTTIWTVLFALNLVGVRTGATVAISVIIYLSFAGMLIYASVMFHKHRKGTLGGAPGGGYKPTQQNDVHTFNPNVSYGYGDANAAPYQPAPYAPQDYGYQSKPAEPYQPQQQQQQPQQAYGYPQQGEAHEMQRPQH